MALAYAQFHSFEEIESWQKAREVAREIYKISTMKAFDDCLLRNQLRNASIAIMGNIAKGFEREGDDFLRHLSKAKGLTGEVRTHLYIALDQGYISLESFKYVGGMLCDVSSLITGLMNYLYAIYSDVSKLNRVREQLGQTRLF